MRTIRSAPGRARRRSNESPKSAKRSRTCAARRNCWRCGRRCRRRTRAMNTSSRFAIAKLRTALTHTSLSGSKIRKVALPTYEDHGELLKWLLLENVPGIFPYTAGVFAFKRENEDPTRMFAGEGDPFKTNTRFKLLSEGMPAKRLSTAFDSVTLYGNDPATRPDIYGKVGNSGRQHRHARRHEGAVFGLRSDRAEHVGVDDDQRPGADDPRDVHEHRDRSEPRQVQAGKRREPTDDEAQKIRAWVLENVRGTVQADILKEDQGQNTCIFSTEFSLKVMGDIQEYFVHHNVKNFYSVSDQRLSHRRSRREPDQPARVHAVERLHVRRGVSGARHAHRRLCAEPELLLQQRHGPRVHRDGPRRAPHLGGGDARQVRRQRAQPEAEVPLPDQRPLAARAGNPVQRHPHDAAGADRHLRQRQQPAHQRVRRSDHDADRRIGTARGGDPDDHQPRMGPGEERESRTRAASSSTS